MPSSFQAPKRGDKAKETTHSQSLISNTAQENATVRKLIDHKGRSVFSITPDDTLSTAVKVLADKHIGALLVTDADGALVGILSERDIVRKLAATPGQTLPQTVAENMTKNVQTCSLDDQLVDVLKTMTDGRFRHIPVLEDGKLCGMLTIGDVVNYRLLELEYEAMQLKQMIVG
ncbi:CBS domain protein [Roseobacter sp. SK209-2-6]|uniref:CBS domain-containing protein n=1 Tax=Roseobacter sp. SK209-2-6 TaxID=388739 RepID=UPI0000F3C176|nr:CBS domain-containing protein [Roseobacter sp. SK209-2-6]EBA15377.1 CBS domain protein [Roseobacter sp. SK209-2-6]